MFERGKLKKLGRKFGRPIRDKKPVKKSPMHQIQWLRVVLAWVFQFVPCSKQDKIKYCFLKRPPTTATPLPDDELYEHTVQITNILITIGVFTLNNLKALAHLPISRVHIGNRAVHAGVAPCVTPCLHIFYYDSSFISV